MTREEFLRRWEAQPRIKFAELIEGIVYMPAPVSDEHGQMERWVSAWLGVYEAATRGVTGENNTTSFILDDTPQPDLNLRLLPEYGGGSWVEEHYVRGTPELLVEVCATSVSYDLHKKYNLYQSAGIPEYLAIVVYEREIRWHVLSEGRYQRLSQSNDGLHRSLIFPGLWLDGEALFAGDLRRVLDRLQDGLNSPEHQEFVAQLAAKAVRR